MARTRAQQSKIDRNAALARMERSILAFRRMIVKELKASIDRNKRFVDKDGRATPTMAFLIMRDLEPVFDAIYGQYRGDRSGLLYQAIVDNCLETFDMPFMRERRMTKRILADYPELWERLEEELTP